MLVKAHTPMQLAHIVGPTDAPQSSPSSPPSPCPFASSPAPTSPTPTTHTGDGGSQSSPTQTDSPTHLAPSGCTGTQCEPVKKDAPGKILSAFDKAWPRFPSSSSPASSAPHPAEEALSDHNEPPLVAKANIKSNVPGEDPSTTPHTQVLFDSGCSYSQCIAQRLVTLLRLPMVPYTSPKTAGSFSGNDSVTITHFVPQLTVDFGTYTEVLYRVPILPEMDSSFDLILGTGWHKLRKAVPDFSNRTVVLRDNAHRVRTVQCDTPSSHASVNIIHAKPFRKFYKSGRTNTGIVFIREAPDGTTASKTPPPANVVRVQGTDKDKKPQLYDITLPSSLSPTKLEAVKKALGVERFFVEQSASDIPPEAERPVHHIDTTPGAPPPYRRPRPNSPVESAEILKHLQQMLKAGVIRPSKSPYGAPVLFASKPDGTLRFCVDYRELNRITKRDRFPLPNVEQLISKLGHASVFSTIDLYSSFWQIKLAEPEKSAFVTEFGQYEFTVMPFGLCNAPSTMQRFMQTAFADLPFVSIYIDDICIFSRSEEEHAEHLVIVLKRLAELKLRVNIRKCSFFAKTIKYLGHIIAHDSVSPDPEYTADILKMNRPTSQPELRRFLGLAGWLRKFCKGYAEITRPFNQLLGKNTPFEWNPELEVAFERLKAFIASPPSLIVADPNLPYTIASDCSMTHAGGVLLQDHGEGLQPIAFRSKTLRDEQLHYSPWELEVFATVDAIEHWHHFVDNGLTLTCLGDHAGLSHLMRLTSPIRRQAHWIMELMPLMPRLSYVPASSPIMAGPDLLTRLPTVAPVTQEQPHTCEHHHTDLSDGDHLTSDAPQEPQATSQPPSAPPADASSPDFPALAKFLAGYDAPSFATYAAKHGLVKHQGMYYKDSKHTVLAVPDDAALKAHLISAFHDVPYVAHRGRENTIQLLRQHYWWKGMSKDVENYVKECAPCQLQAIPNTKPNGELQPEELAMSVFDTMAMDFITHLPPSTKGNSACLTVVDKMSRAVIFIPIKDDTVTAEETAHLFRKNVFSRGWGVPLKLISDRDKRFLSQFWRELHRLLGSRLAYSTAFHAQTDSASEICHRELLDMLRSFTAPLKRRWDEFVDLLEFAHNNHPNASTGFSPFQLLYGRAPRTPSTILDPALACVPAELGEHIRTRQLIQALAERNVIQAQARQKHYYDQRHSPWVKFKVGDFVYVENSHYNLKSPSPKTEDRWLGPFEVEERIGKLDYKLKLPSHLLLHPVFHVTRLRRHTPITAYSHPPPAHPVAGHKKIIEAVLTHRRGKGRGGPISFSVKFADEPLPPEPIWLTHAEAFAISPEVIKEYMSVFQPGGHSGRAV